ncbi:MAG: glycoside hydrolase family 3 N-terminal domain-containing protein, partial [Micromonosporaceae bacterium]
MPLRLTSLAVCSALVVASFATGCSPGQPDAGGDTPAPRRTGPPVARAAAIAKSLNQTQLVGQVLMPFVYGDHASKISDASAAANLEAYGASTPAKVLRRYQLGGLILVSQSADPTSSTNPTTNVDSPKQVRELTSGLQHAATKLGVARNAGEPMPLLIGTDQEHGVVTRIRDGMTLLPTAAGFGAAADPALTERAWKMGGGELSAVGVNVDFAPSADVIGSAGNQVIGSRSYGSDPAQVAK